MSHIFHDLREEIMLRLDRETKYVIALSEALKDKDNYNPAKSMLENKIADNDKALKLINEFLSSRKDWATDDLEWEKFVNQNFLNKETV